MLLGIKSWEMVLCPGVRCRTGGEFLVVGVTFLCCPVSTCVVQVPKKGHQALICLLPYSLRFYSSQQLVITGTLMPSSIYFFFYFIYLFILAALDLCCFSLAFSSCLKWGLLFVVACGLLIAVASLVAEPAL